MARLPRGFRTVCLYHSRSFTEVTLIGASYPLRFSKSCLQPPLLPGFYPHSQGATLGPVHVGVRSQTRPHHNRDGAWRFGCCHLFSDLQGSGDYPQSPEQGEWMSLLQTFPITNRPPRHQRIFCSLDSCLFVFSRLRRLTIVEHCWVRLMQPWLVLSWFLPRCDVAVHRHPRSPTGDAARPPAFVPPPPRLALLRILSSAFTQSQSVPP